MLWTRLDTPIGPLTLTAGERGLRTIHFAVEAVVLDPAMRNDRALAEPRRQLTEYFAGERRAFDLALDPVGTAFQQRVWRAVRAVPYGETTTYRAVADALGGPRLSRAVGACNGRTPIPIVMPCHRVVGSDGRLTGYRGGLEVKRALLDLERGQAARTAGPGASRASSDRSTSISTIPPAPRVRTVGS
jgi:methylated-DNA-[protein]-cysteine S-methyltransferase